MLKSADVELIELAIKRAYFDECLLDPKLAKKLLENLYHNRYINPNFVEKNLIDPPTERQIQVLRLLAQGLVFEQIAKEMFLSVSTVKCYASDLYSKWGVKNRYEAIKRGALLGYIDYNLIVNE
jgi:DNA-binding NarL/FixJ family response regulator